MTSLRGEPSKKRIMKKKVTRSRRVAALAVAMMFVSATAAHAQPDDADFVEIFNRDVFVLAGASTVNPDDGTPDSATLFSTGGEDLGITWGEWQLATATSRVNQIGGPIAPRTQVRIDLAGLVPHGVYSIFYGTLGPDTENPKCPGVERTLPVAAFGPSVGGPDAASFIADEDGATTFHGMIEGAPLEATQVFFSVIYHWDGQTYGDLPNRGEWHTYTQGEDCRSSFGLDAMRQLVILQKW